MYRLTASSQIILDVVVALALLPLAVTCAAVARAALARRRRRAPTEASSVPVAVTACALAAGLAIAFVVPIISGGANVDTRMGLIVLARAAQSGGWAAQPLEPVVRHAREQPGLEDLAALLALTTSDRPGANLALPDALFIGGARLATAPLAGISVEGWSAHDLGTGHCEVILYFRPRTALSGNQVWLHEYPAGSRDYVDLALSLPARDWTPGPLAWEVFKTATPGTFTLYAGVQTGGDLGPAVPLGHVDRCAP